MEDQQTAEIATEGMSSAPHEAPAKKQLTDEEKANHARMVIHQGILEDMANMKELTDLVKEKGYQSHVYSEESNVTIPSTMFAHIINFMTTVDKHNQNVHAIFGDMMDAANSVRLGALDFQVYLTEKHIENCEQGIAQPVKPLVASEKAPKKKAKGSKN